MVHSGLRSDATLGEWLAAHARGVSDRRLALDVVGGTLAALIVVVWRPAGWPALLGSALCFAAFGVWAVAERRLAERRPLEPLIPLDGTSPRDWSPAWRILRATAGVAGALAAMLTVFAFLFSVLGTWIS